MQRSKVKAAKVHFFYFMPRLSTLRAFEKKDLLDPSENAYARKKSFWREDETFFKESTFSTVILHETFL